MAVPLTYREFDVLAELRHDLAEGGEGVHRWTVEEIDGTCHPHRTIANLRAHGHIIGLSHDGMHYQLSHAEPTPTAAHDTSSPVAPPVGGVEHPPPLSSCAAVGPGQLSIEEGD